MLTFMDNETYEQVTVSADLVGEPVVFLQEGMTVTIESYEDEPISVMLPDTVVMQIVQSTRPKRASTVAKASAHCVSDVTSSVRNRPSRACLVTVSRLRSEERRVGKGCVSPCTSRWSAYT